jgi:hypothetical protein
MSQAPATKARSASSGQSWQPGLTSPGPPHLGELPRRRRGVARRHDLPALITHHAGQQFSLARLVANDQDPDRAAVDPGGRGLGIADQALPAPGHSSFPASRPSSGTERNHSTDRRTPSLTGTIGHQPRASQAWLMTGRRRAGSPAGSRRRSIPGQISRRGAPAPRSARPRTPPGYPDSPGPPQSSIATRPRTRSST